MFLLLLGISMIVGRRARRDLVARFVSCDNWPVMTIDQLSKMCQLLMYHNYMVPIRPYGTVWY